MTMIASDKKRAYLMDRLIAAPEGVEIKETTPKKGGFRNRDAKDLIAEGVAEWTDDGRVRLTTKGREEYAQPTG